MDYYFVYYLHNNFPEGYNEKVIRVELPWPQVSKKSTDKAKISRKSIRQDSVQLASTVTMGTTLPSPQIVINNFKNTASWTNRWETETKT